MALRGQIFQERQHAVYFHDVRIFIFGVEVTPWLTESVNITLSDRNGPNTATFTLSNPIDAFVLTEENLGWQRDANGNVIRDVQRNPVQNPNAGIWRVSGIPRGIDSGVYTDVQYSEQAKRKLFEEKSKLNKDSSGKLIIDPLTNNTIYPLNPGSLIFHKHDTVRIFILNPLHEPNRISPNPTITDVSKFAYDEQWQYGFTGFLDKKPLSKNYINSESSITFNAYCVKSMMQKMRFQVNVLAQTFSPEDRNSAIFETNVGFFADVQVNNPEGMSHPLAGRNLEDSVSILITGQDLPINVDAGTTTGIFERDHLATDLPNAEPKAVGRFTLGSVYRFNGLNQNPTMLEDWYQLCLLGKKRNFLTRDEVTFIGSNSGPYQSLSPWNQQLHMLLPGDGTGLDDVVTYATGTIADSRSWETRFALVLEIVSNLDYQWWTTPSGDMVLEFPQMDFFPEDYGLFKSVMEFNYDLINSELDDEEGEIFSYITCTGGYSNEHLQPSIDNAPQAFIPRVTIQSDLLAIRYGVIGSEAKNFPFLLKTNEPITEAIEDRLARLSLIEFQKRLSEVNNLHYVSGFRPFLLPNKPVYIIPERRMGTTTGITLDYALPPSNTASSNTTLRYIRTLMPDGRFLLITGGDSMPLSYREIYNSNETYKINKGVNVRFNDANTKRQ